MRHWRCVKVKAIFKDGDLMMKVSGDKGCLALSMKYMVLGAVADSRCGYNVGNMERIR